MTTAEENEVFTPEEQDWINFVRRENPFVKRMIEVFFPAKPLLTPEQDAAVLEHIKRGETLQAQKIILDALEDKDKAE